MSDHYKALAALTAAANSCGWGVVSAESSSEQITLIVRLDAKPENIERAPSQFERGAWE